jgi:hypothetical protein
MKLVSGQGSTFRWGVYEFLVTSIDISVGGAANEIDITSMSSKKVPDEDNTGKFLIERDWDTAFAGANDAEVQIDFFAEQWIGKTNPLDLVGLKRDLRMTFPADEQGRGEGFSLGERKAVLTQMSLGVSTGEFVTGSATFRLSGD